MNAYSRKGHERDCTQMPMAKKERTDHKCLWQRKKDQTTNVGGKRKMAALIRQANSWHQIKDQTTKAVGKRKRAALSRQANIWHQMKETKQLKPPQKRKRWPTCKHKVEKTPPNHREQSNRLLSAKNEWTTTLTTFVAAIRVQSKNNCRQTDGKPD